VLRVFVLGWARPGGDASSFARNAPIQKTPGSSEAGCERKQVTVLISDASLLEWIQ